MQGVSERVDAMNRDAFLKRVNVRAETRYGVSEITHNVLNDWLEAKIINAPEKHGRVRDWGPKEYQRALEIVRLKYQGAEELREIRFHLWAKGLNVNFLDAQSKDRKCLLRAFIEFRNGLTKSVHSTYPHVKNPDANAWPAKSVIRNMGELDPSLAKIAKYENSELLAAYRLAKFGEVGLKDLDRPIEQLGKMVLNSSKFIFGNLPILLGQLSGEIRRYVQEFGGFFERNPEFRNSVDRTILEATPEQYEIARQIYRLLVRVFSKMGLRKVSNSLLHPKWRLTIFVLALHLTFRLSKSRQPNAALGLKELESIEANYLT